MENWAQCHGKETHKVLLGGKVRIHNGGSHLDLCYVSPSRLCPHPGMSIALFVFGYVMGKLADLYSLYNNLVIIILPMNEEPNFIFC